MRCIAKSWNSILQCLHVPFGCQIGWWNVSRLWPGPAWTWLINSNRKRNAQKVQIVTAYRHCRCDMYMIFVNVFYIYIFIINSALLGKKPSVFSLKKSDSCFTQPRTSSSHPEKPFPGSSCKLRTPVVIYSHGEFLGKTYKGTVFVWATKS